MAKVETVPIGELEQRLPAKLLPLLGEYRDKLEKLTAEQGGRLTLAKGDDPKELRRALKAAAVAVNRRADLVRRSEAELLALKNFGRKEKAREIEHVARVEPYLLAMNPTEGHNFAMHVGLRVGDAKRLKSNSIPAREDSP